MSDHTSCMEMVTLSMYFNVEMVVRHYHAYQSVSVAVVEKLSCKMEGANSEDLYAVAVMTGKLIVGCKKIPQFARCFCDKIGQFLSIYWFRGNCARLVVNKKFS